LQFHFNAEGVGKFEPRVCFETLGIGAVCSVATLKELQRLSAMAAQPFQGSRLS
jgi:hypothetical protein